MLYLGIDTGGTFTDFVLFSAQQDVRVHKVLSTPQAPEQAIIQGIQELGLALKGLRIVHGSTVATNAALEGKGVRTAYVTNRGFADVLSIGRQTRRELYNLQPVVPKPPVPAELCLETGGRVSAQGEMLEPITEQDIQVLRKQLTALAPEAVAINLLFAYQHPELEQHLLKAVPDNCFVSLSSQVLPEIKEYERGMATWLNAWLGPKVAGYLTRLQTWLGDVPLSVMQSSGETVTANQAAQQAVRLLLSGPAGGLVGAQHVAQYAGEERLLTFDMGGTSTDVALVDGELQLTIEGRIGDYPVAVPMMDMHTIGAGGGSIAWIDEGGMLQLGPQSAGATPGPACYGRGGKQATVTDANLLLGRIQAEAFLGGRMQLDIAAAEAAMQVIAQHLACGVVQAARAVVDVANAHMVRALRAISIKRGADSRDFTLVSFGGAGGLHVCELAEELDIQRALVPVHGGVLSALGMLAARPGRQVSRTLAILLDADSDGLVAKYQAELLAQVAQQIAAEGLQLADCGQQVSVDLRYRGQSYTLNLPWQGYAASLPAFHKKHERRYGHRMDLPVELVTLRLAVRALQGNFVLPQKTVADICELPYEKVYVRGQIQPGMRMHGPAMITEEVATTWLAGGWSARCDQVGNLILSRSPGMAYTRDKDEGVKI